MTFPTTKVKVDFKRVRLDGTSFILDFTITNKAGQDIRVGCAEPETSAYDDEGNVYKPNSKSSYKIASFTLGDFTGRAPSDYFYDNFTVNIPSGITYKMRVVVEGVDEYATCFDLVRLYMGIKTGSDSSNMQKAFLEIRGLQIPRD